MKIKVASVSELEGQDMIGRETDELNIVLFKLTDGSIVALEDRCSHADVKLSDGEYDPVAGEVTCTAHGARFCAKGGKQLCMPAVMPVRAYPVEVIEGGIFVEVDDFV